MAEIVIKIEGREVTPANMANLMHRIVVKSMQEQLQQKLARTLCPDHGFGPIVTVDIVGGRQHISITGCCQRLVDMTRIVLATPEERVDE